MDMGEYEKAFQICVDEWQQNPDTADPNNVWLILLMGRLYHRDGDSSRASSFFKLAEELSGGNLEVLRRVEMYYNLTNVLPSSKTDIENLINPDVVLIQVPAWGVNTPPLGTALLTSYARKQGYKVFPIDLNIEFYLDRGDEFSNSWELEQSMWFWVTQDSVKRVIEVYNDYINAVVDLIVATKAPVIGFSIYGTSEIMSREIAKRLKAKNPTIKIIFGGPHVSRFIAGSTIVQDESVDAVAQGEGELVLVDILERIKSGQTLEDCTGLMLYRNGEVIDNGDKELIKNLNEIPAPDFSDFTFENYKTPTRLPIMSSRGCANQCIFCNERPFWKKFRYRSAENVFAEINTQIKRYPFINFLDFQDSLVNGSIREMERLSDLIIENDLNIQWAGQAVVRKEMTVELMTKLKKSGCVCMAYGMETSSSSLMLKVGKVMSKGADINTIAEAHKISGLGAVYNVMFGLPGETEEDSFDTLEFLRRNYKAGLSVNPSPGFCGFSPGTLGYEHPEKYGIDFAKGGMYWESMDGQNTYLRRLKRFEDFCRLVQELGVQTTYPASHLLDRNRALGEYYLFIGDKTHAKYYFKEWLNEHPDDQNVRTLMESITEKLLV